MGIDDELTCELCGLPIVDDSYHDGHDGETYHEDCCPSCNGAEWKQQRDELLEVCQNLADELEAEIKARYRETPLLYPTMRARYDQDMSTINQARSVIALAKGQTE